VRWQHLGRRPFGIYVHVPFCRTRCGYCDFNTYTAAELGPGASRDSYAGLAVAEVRLARRVLGAAELPVTTRVLRRRDPHAAAASRPGRDPARHRR
jgi:oxygen-independent coproporphyrinogen-3 oxidase